MSSSKRAGGGGGGSGGQSEVALAMLQAIELQASLQGMLLEGYEWAFKACTREGSGPQLSAREGRCVQSAMALVVESRAHMAAALQAGAGQAAPGTGGNSANTR